MDQGGITRAELARRLGRTRGFVTQLLGGGRNLTLGTLADVADAIERDISVRLVRRKTAAARAGAKSA